MHRGNTFHQFTRPWSTLRLPTVWIAALQYGCLIGGIAVISFVGSVLLSAPPYLWGAGAGLLSVGALVGILGAVLYTCLFTDNRVKRLARKHDHGHAESESRVPVMLPSLATATGGLLVFGFCAEYVGEYQWVGMEFASGMVAFGLVQVSAVWYSYVSSLLGRPTAMVTLTMVAVH